MALVNSRVKSGALIGSFLAIVCLFAAMCFAQSTRPAQVKSAAKSGKGDITAIQHIVFIVKENRSFDNYFGQYPGADGTTTGLFSTGQTMVLEHTPDQVVDMGHDWTSAITAMDGGKMDNYDLILYGNVNGALM